MGNPNLAVYANGYMLEDYPLGDIPLDTLDRMRVRDPIVKFASRFVARSVRRRLGEYTHDDPKVADWVRRRVMPALTKGLPGIQTALYYGVSVTQPVYGRDADGLFLRRLYTVPPGRYYERKGFQRDDSGDLSAVDIEPFGMVPVNNPDTGFRDLIVMSSDDDFGNPWGNAAARQAFTAWYIKNRLQAFEAMGAEAHGLPRAWFKVNSIAASGDQATPGQDYVDRWKAMGVNGAMAIDGADELTVIPGAWTNESPFDAIMRRLDGYIFNSFYLPYLLMAEGKFGTRAQADVALEAYLMAETDLAEELADLAVMQVIAAALWTQYGAGMNPGTIPIRDASPPDRESWMRILTGLAAIGLWDPDVTEQVQWAGELFEVPTAELLRMTGGGVGPGEAQVPADVATGNEETPVEGEPAATQVVKFPTGAGTPAGQRATRG